MCMCASYNTVHSKDLGGCSYVRNTRVYVDAVFNLCYFKLTSVMLMLIQFDCGSLGINEIHSGVNLCRG